MPNENGDNITFTMEELQEMFGGNNEQETPPADDGNKPATEGQTEGQSEQKEQDPTETQVFARRLKERTDKAVAEERERIVQSLGYTSYEDMQKQKEKKMFEDKGLDPEQVSPIVDELVKKKIEEDPRIKELEQFKQKQVQEFAQRELNEISKLTGVKYESLNQLPQDVIEDWRKTGSLKKSYIALHGEELIMKARSGQSRGDTSHLQSSGGSTPAPSTGRVMTDKEKAIYKMFNPSVTDEELNKKTIKD